MSRFNFVSTRLDRELCKDDTTLYLAQAIDPYVVPHRYASWLLLFDDPKRPTKMEVIRVDTLNVGLDLHTRTVTARAVEGKTPTRWPVGTYVTIAQGYSTVKDLET